MNRRETFGFSHVSLPKSAFAGLAVLGLDERTPLTSREEQVLAVLRDPLNRGVVNGGAHLARLLNLDAACDWCPVGPPKPGERCASVPPTSRQRCKRVLMALRAKGLVVRRYMGRDNYSYLLPEVSAWWGDGFPVA